MSGRTGRPRSRVQRLRRWVLVSAVIFATLLATLIGYTRYRALKARLDLPKQLGLDIKSETDSFTISRNVKGRTLFTIHASKAIQHQNGLTTLRDVAVTLYGPPGSNRTDTIRGAEFEYDQSNGIVRAMGDTLVDVGITEGSNVSPAAKRLTMQGKGLVFLEKLGVASTGEQIRFQYGASQGEAVGADYEMDTGVLTLQHQVHLHSVENGHIQRVDAASAQLDRNTRVATLQNATLTDAEDAMDAPHLVATLRSAPDEHAGTLDHVDASGGVTLHTGTGQRVRAPQLHADVTPLNQLRQVTMQGGVTLQDDQTTASSQRALLRFASGHPEHLTLTGQAHLQQNAGLGVNRTVDAAEIQSSLNATAGAHLTIADLHASGSAKLVLLQPARQAGHVDRTELTAPTLVAHTVSNAETAEIRDLEASRGAHLFQDDGSGSVRTSNSDDLSAAFAPLPASGQSAALQSLVQHGHVTIHETRQANAGQPGTPAQSSSQTDATADRAEFSAATDLLVLTGAPHVTGNGLQLSATRITLHRGTGDAEASGAVRGSITQATSAPAATKARTDATQFAGDSVRLTHSSGAVLLQGGGTDARLWSGTGQIEAPTIQADQKANTLRAFGGAPNASTPAVKTVLIQQAAPDPAPPGSTGNPRVPTRVFSRELFYRGGSPGSSGTADFRGGVRLLEGDDVITADTAVATLRPGSASQAATPAAVPMLGSGLQSVTADGHVRIQQGQRTATGAHLLYAVSSRNAVLTGAPGLPPVAHDPVQGTLTGAELLLHLGQGKGDNQVEVSGAPTMPVHTELDVPEKSGGPASQARSRAGRKPRPTP